MENLFYIKLSNTERRFIKACKGHYPELFKDSNVSWSKALRPLFEDIYGWKPSSNLNDYRRILIRKLFDIYMKIRCEEDSNEDLKELIFIGLEKSIGYRDANGYDRVIAKLCGLIQGNRVKFGTFERYSLIETIATVS